MTYDLSQDQRCGFCTLSVEWRSDDPKDLGKKPSATTGGVRGRAAGSQYLFWAVKSNVFMVSSSSQEQLPHNQGRIKEGFLSAPDGVNSPTDNPLW